MRSAQQRSLLQEYLAKQQLSKSDVRSLISGLAEALQTQDLAMISFAKFARGYQWFVRTLEMMLSRHDGSTATEANGHLSD